MVRFFLNLFEWMNTMCKIIKNNMMSNIAETSQSTDLLETNKLLSNEEKTQRITISENTFNSTGESVKLLNIITDDKLKKFQQ